MKCPECNAPQDVDDPFVCWACGHEFEYEPEEEEVLETIPDHLPTFENIQLPEVHPVNCRCPQRRWLEFHGRNPQLFARMVAVAHEAKGHGFETFGVAAIIERLRWNEKIQGLPDPLEEYKISDPYAAGYARLIAASEPELADLFNMKKTKPCAKCGTHWDDVIGEALDGAEEATGAEDAAEGEALGDRAEDPAEGSEYPDGWFECDVCWLLVQGPDHCCEPAVP